MYVPITVQVYIPIAVQIYVPVTVQMYVPFLVQMYIHITIQWMFSLQYKCMFQSQCKCMFHHSITVCSHHSINGVFLQEKFFSFYFYFTIKITFMISPHITHVSVILHCILLSNADAVFLLSVPKSTNFSAAFSSQLKCYDTSPLHNKCQF